MVFNILAFFFGILLCQHFTFLPSLSWLWILIPLSLCLQILPVLRPLGFLGLGFCWMFWTGHHILTAQLPTLLEGEVVTVSGQIHGIPKQSEQYGYVRFDFVTTELVFQDKSFSFPAKIRLRWYHNSTTPPAHLLPDQRWQFAVKLKRPRKLNNFHIFDYETYLFQQRIRADGYIRQEHVPKLLADPPWWSVDQLRYQFTQRLQTILQDHPMKSIIIALVVGERQFISESQWTVFKHTGTAHLIAISGLHIGIIAFWFGLLANYGWRILPSAALWLPAPVIAGIVSVFAAGIYATLAGFSLPTQRAFIMVAVVGLTFGFANQLPAFHRLLLALFFILLYDPLATLSVGFWLSFMTVAFILLFSISRQHFNQPNWLKPLSLLFRLQGVVTLGLIVILSYNFHFISLSSFPSNIIAIPLISLFLPFIILISLLFTWTGLAEFFLPIMADSLEWLYYLLERLANLSWSIKIVAAVPWWISLSAFIGTIIILLPTGFPARWVGILWLLPLFWFNRPSLPEGAFEATVLDVGQSLSIVIRTKNHILIYDTGTQFVGGSILMPFLWSKGITEVDKLMISHSDNDHAGGIYKVINNFLVKQIISGQLITGIDNVPQKRCIAGENWQWDGVTFQILHPYKNYRSRKDNDYSCVIKIKNHQHHLLLTADITRLVEYRLLKSTEKSLKSNILLAPHHGSRTSSAKPFLQTVSPEIAIFSVGYLNRYRHPHPKVLARYRQLGIETLQTSQTGAIRLYLPNDEQRTIEFARTVNQRFWHQKE